MIEKVMIHSSNTSATLYYSDGTEPKNLVASSPDGLVMLLRVIGINLNGKAA